MALSASVSFFVFFALHAAVVAARHTIDAADIPISTYQSWMLKVRCAIPIGKSCLSNRNRVTGKEIKDQTDQSEGLLFEDVAVQGASRQDLRIIMAPAQGDNPIYESCGS